MSASYSCQHSIIAGACVPCDRDFRVLHKALVCFLTANSAQMTPDERARGNALLRKFNVVVGALGSRSDDVVEE